MNTEGLCMGCMNDNGGEKNCPICGFDNTVSNPLDCLPIKSFIRNRYILGTVLNRDGEGITYIGWDNARMAKVKIKEYYPVGFAHRNPDKTVSINENGKYTFNEGLLEFIDINRHIITSTLPSLTKVFDVFEENGTAYSVFEFISGITLEEFLKKNGGILKWEQARPLFLSVIDTVGGMNDMGIIHGGISADTIIVGRDGKLKIEGYSIKKLRRDDSELQSKIYPGYAACEQYGVNSIAIDTYTDVYGLCATLFRVLIGITPPEAIQRMQSDVMTIPSRFAEELPRQVLSALANGLQVLPANRTRTIELFKNELVYGEIAVPVVPKKAVVNDNAAENSKAPKKNNTTKYILVSAICTVSVILVIALILYFTVFKSNGDDDNQSSSAITSSTFTSEDPKFGETASGVTSTIPLEVVPNFVGQYYSDVVENHDYDAFKLTIKDKAFSDKYPKGTICEQSIKDGTEVEEDTEIEVIVSLGPKEIEIASVIGMPEEAAKLELVRQGFLYENIITEYRYNPNAEPGVVIAQSPVFGSKVSPDGKVTIEINTYTEEETDTESDQPFYDEY